MDALDSLEDLQFRERFDTGIRKIRHEIRSLLAHHGLFGTITDTAIGQPNSVPESATVEIEVKGVTTGRLFDRPQIEGCCLRVSRRRSVEPRRDGGRSLRSDLFRVRG